MFRCYWKCGAYSLHLRKCERSPAAAAHQKQRYLWMETHRNHSLNGGARNWNDHLPASSWHDYSFDFHSWAACCLCTNSHKRKLVCVQFISQFFSSFGSHHELTLLKVKNGRTKKPQLHRFILRNQRFCMLYLHFCVLNENKQSFEHWKQCRETSIPRQAKKFLRRVYRAPLIPECTRRKREKNDEFSFYWHISVWQRKKEMTNRIR